MNKDIYDVSGDVISTIRMDEVNNRLVIKTSQDIEPYLNYNKHCRDNQEKHGKSKDIKSVASIPFAVAELWYQNCYSKNPDRNIPQIDIFNPEHADRVKKILNDPDYSFLRTSTGRL